MPEPIKVTREQWDAARKRCHARGWCRLGWFVMPGERTFRCIACGRVLVVDPKVRRPAAVCICAECVRRVVVTMPGERWEDMPDVETAVFDAIDASAHTALPHTVISAMTENALAAAVEAVPVVPVRVLRQWIEQEEVAIRCHPHDSEYPDGVRAALNILSKRLDDYEKENPNG